MFGLPMIKLGGLIVRTLTKPLAKEIKTQSKKYQSLTYVCHALGQSQHRTYIKFHMGFRGIQSYTIKDIPEDQAVEKGADLLGELLIFGVAVAVASYEYTRSSAKSKENERRAEAAKRAAQQEIEERFEKLELQVIWLEQSLAELGHIVEHDIDVRLHDAAATTTNSNATATPVATVENVTAPVAQVEQQQQLPQRKQQLQQEQQLPQQQDEQLQQLPHQQDEQLQQLLQQEQQQLPQRKRHRRNVTTVPGVHVGVDLNDLALAVTARSNAADGDASDAAATEASDAAASSIWTVPYESIAALFRSSK